MNDLVSKVGNQSKRYNSEHLWYTKIFIKVHKKEIEDANPL